MVASLSVFSVLVFLSLPPFSPLPPSPRLLLLSFPPPLLLPVFCFLFLAPFFLSPFSPFPLFPPLFSFTPLSGGLLWTVVWFGGWSPWSAAQPQQVSKNGDGGVVHDSSSKTGRPATEVSRHNRPSPERCLYEQVLQDCVLIQRMMPIFVFTGTQLPCRPTNLLREAELPRSVPKGTSLLLPVNLS